MLKESITAIAIGFGVAVAVVASKYFRRRKVVTIGDLNCDESLKATKHGSTRDMGRVRLIVLHSTEGATAKGAANWFANPASQGSAHIVVDDNNCFRTLSDDVVPWGAKGGNSNMEGLHLEMAGFAKWSRDEWLLHQGLLNKAADVVNYWANKYNIPLVFLDAEDLKKAGISARGITTHAALKDAFGQDSHWDPGPGFPIDVLMDKAGADYKTNPFV